MYLPPGKMERGRRRRGLEEEFADRLTSPEGVVGGKVRYTAEGLTGWDGAGAGVSWQRSEEAKRAVYVLKA